MQQSTNGKRCVRGESSFVTISRPSKEMNTKNISGYPQYMLDSLSERLHDSIVCLLQNFEVFVNSGILEVVLHSVTKCAFFFGLPYHQQKEVVRASFYPFRIDGQGRVISFVAATQRKFKLTKKERELLCISYIISQKGVLHYQQVLANFKKKIKTKKGTDELEYFRKRQDLFFVGDKGHVHLVNVPTIKWNYVSFIVSEKFVTPMLLLCLPEVKVSNNDCEILSKNKLESSWSSNNARPNQNISQVESSRIEHISSEIFLKEKTKLQKEKDLKEVKLMTDRVRNVISYLSQYFILIANTDLLHLILSVLDDVKNYYLNLTAQSREDFVKECFSIYYISSGGFISSATLSNSCMLSDEEKIELLSAFEIGQQSEWNYIKMLENFSKCTIDKSSPVNNPKEMDVTDTFTVLKSGVPAIKTNETKYFGVTKANGNVLTVPPHPQLNKNLPPRGATNWWESSYPNDFNMPENYNAAGAMNAHQMDQLSSSLYSLYAQPLPSSKCVSNDIFSPTVTSQERLNCGGCAALSWSEISIFEEDESYYTSLIDSFLAK